MNWIAKTLWDLIAPLTESQAQRIERPPSKARSREAARRPSKSQPSMQQRYDGLVAEMKKTYGVRVRKWRTSSTGCAWEVHYANGSTVRLIESPYPKGPMSCAIFLHEIGHHAIGFKTYRPRCLEEYHAWKWAFDAMRERGFNVTKAVERRMAESLHYAIAKARRRGLRDLPPELGPFVSASRRHRSATA